MKKLICILFLGVFIFSACSTLRDEKEVDGLPLLPVNDAQIVTPEERTTTFNLSLYGYDSVAKRLSVTTKEVATAQTDKATFVLQILLQELEKSNFGKLRLEFMLLGAAATGEIAQINITTNKKMEEESLFILAAVITNTAIDNLNVKYVNLIINDSPIMLQGLPQGLLSKSGINIVEVYEQKLTNISSASASYEILLPIYYIDKDTNYIMPEVRKVQLEKTATLETISESILQELALYTNKAGRVLPVTSAILHSKSQEKAEGDPLEELPDTETPDNSTPIAEPLAKANGTVTFAYAESFLLAGEQKEAAMACLYFSLNTVIDDLRQIHFIADGQSASISIAQGWAYLGNEIAIYLPKTDLFSMKKVMRAVAAPKAYATETYIEELMRGPVGAEKETLQKVFPEKISMAEFLWLAQSGDLLTINFSNELLRHLDDFSEQQQIMFVYTIINTVCERENVKQVQFIFDKKPETFLHEQGRLTLQAPLLPNPGLIAE